MSEAEVEKLGKRVEELESQVFVLREIVFEIKAEDERRYAMDRQILQERVKAYMERQQEEKEDKNKSPTILPMPKIVHEKQTRDLEGSDNKFTIE